MSFDPITLAMAKPKEVDLTRFVIEDSGVSDTLNNVILGLVNLSVQSGGTLQHTGFNLCEGLRKALSTTQQVVGVMGVQNYRPRFPVMVSLLDGIVVNASTSTLVNMDGAAVEVKTMFVWFDDPTDERVATYVKATVLS